MDPNSVLISTSQNPYEIGTFFILVLWMREMKHRLKNNLAESTQLAFG